MAAYAALVSLMNNMKQIQNHPHLSTSLDKKQIESLGEKVGFFLDFIEIYTSHGGISKEAEDLVSQIASAAHAAEDVIESHLVDQILAGSTKTFPSFLLHLQKKIEDIKKKLMKVQEWIQSKDEKSRLRRVMLDLQKIMKDMDSIKEKIMKVKEEKGFENQQPTYSMLAASSRPLTTGKTTMVGFDSYLNQLLEELTGQRFRQIVPIVGMGGIGKTTLAKNVYENLLIVEHFEVRAWVTVSQDYNVREIFLKALSCLEKFTSRIDDDLGDQLHKILSGRRYLIILDDMWSTDVWDQINRFFPDNGNGSRVVVTTRLSDVAIHCGSSCISSCLRMNFLDEDKSWNLFCKNVFGHEECPRELEQIGKEIAKLCKGLPLSIAVIGGLLRKSYRTIGYWQNVAENINSILSSGEDEQCWNVLSLSYNHLPAYLKSCFLYMGIFQEDHEIRASRIIKLWVAEGFIKPKGAQILEEIAEGYLKDLIDRNLILVDKHRRNGKIRSCRIHDLLRDLCLRVAEKEKFFCVMRARGIPHSIDGERRLIFHGVFHDLQSTSLVRSLICERVQLPVKFRLLRVLNMGDNCSLDDTFQKVNLRYLLCQPWRDSVVVLPSSISLIWNLQTLIIRGAFKLVVAPFEIWKMPQLRHVEFDEICLPDPPPSDRQDGFFVLENLQTLLTVVNFRWSEEVCKRIPNIKKLHIKYDDSFKGYDDCSDYCIYNLGRLDELESLNIKFFFMSLYPIDLLKNNLRFPSSLNKLSLTNCHLHWKDLTMIGSLPKLEVLKLEKNSVMGCEWITIDGEFLRLKFLRIDHCDLVTWTADSSHFPSLENLVLVGLSQLNEIPCGIGEIATLKLIRLECCSACAASSAMIIKEEQENLGNDGLQVKVRNVIGDLDNLESYREMVVESS